MIYLLMAVVSSTLISIFMRVGDKYIKNNMVMFLTNYTIAIILSRLSMGQLDLFTHEEGIGFTVAIGLFSGVMFLVSFMMLQFNIQKNGVVLSATFMKLGVLVPTIMAVAIFHEQPKVFKLVGILIAIAAIIVINGGGAEAQGEGKSFKIWLIILLLLGGFTDSLANIYDKNGVADLKNHYLFYTFLAAALLCVIMIFVKKQRVTLADVLWGALIGVPNFYSSKFLLSALGDLPAIVVYPAYNVATILAISLLGILLFKEKMNLRKATGLGMIVLAIILLNL